MKVVEFKNEEKYIKDFLSFPRRLYSKNENMEDSDNTEKLLRGCHILNKYFSLHKFLVYDEEHIVARFIITIYPNDKTAYFGFFECADDEKVAKKVFETADKVAKKLGCERVIGPIDASFWLKYRLKINNFDGQPYTGEPYNKSYYIKFFKNNGYEVCDHYTSSRYKTANNVYQNDEYSKKYQEFKKNGYEIRSLKSGEFKNRLAELYELLTSLYCDFPLYKNISKDDFCELFKNYEKIIDLSMIKIGLKDGKMVGFFISVPNYHNNVYNINICKLLKIFRIKKSPEEYVMLYIGVDQKHHGLGRALVYSIIQELNKNKKSSIGALAHDGKVTQKYAEDMIDNIYEYVILKKDLK